VASRVVFSSIELVSNNEHVVQRKNEVGFPQNFFLTTCCGLTQLQQMFRREGKNHSCGDIVFPYNLKEFPELHVISVSHNSTIRTFLIPVIV
jgi:hypothetical protein